MSKLTDKIEAELAEHNNASKHAAALRDILADVQELELDLAAATAVADEASDRNVAARRTAKRAAYELAQQICIDRRHNPGGTLGCAEVIKDAIDALDEEEGT